MTREEMIEKLVLDSADTVLAEMGEDDKWVYFILRKGFVGFENMSDLELNAELRGRGLLEGANDKG